MPKITKKTAGRPANIWPPEKVKHLKRLYPKEDNADVAKKLGVTESALRNAAIRYKVKKSDRYWDKPWENYLLKNWKVMTALEIANGLKSKFKVEKTRWAVINKYRELTK